VRHEAGGPFVPSEAGARYDEPRTGDVSMSTRISHLRILASAALLLAACGDPLGPGPEPITELPRALTPQEEAVIGDANAFGLALVAEMAGRDPRPNIVLSPLSASMALGMTMNGAAGTTFDAMRRTLGFGQLSQEEINAAYRGLIDLLTSLDPEVRFDIANAVWANQGFPFYDAFFQAVAAAFDARAESADFSDPATVDSINAWAADNTDGLIERILDELDPDLVMLLLNAIYFDGSWTTRFDPADTHRQAFTREDGSTVQVDMMSLDGVTLPLGGGPDWSAVELPYGGGAFAMVIVVPWGGAGARAFLRDLDTHGWENVIASLHDRKVDLVSIPKLTLTYDAYLNDPLKAMGMEVAFGPGADFTGMSPNGDQLCIDFVRQKTFLEVDERGTRAAAVTSVGIGPTSFNGLVADRPFAFALRERLSGTILFAGMVGDPTYRDPGAEPIQGACH
jgi:serine protease inhibitor